MYPLNFHVTFFFYMTQFYLISSFILSNYLLILFHFFKYMQIFSLESSYQWKKKAHHLIKNKIKNHITPIFIFFLIIRNLKSQYLHVFICFCAKFLKIKFTQSVLPFEFATSVFLFSISFAVNQIYLFLYCSRYGI